MGRGVWKELQLLKEGENPCGARGYTPFPHIFSMLLLNSMFCYENPTSKTLIFSPLPQVSHQSPRYWLEGIYFFREIDSKFTNTETVTDSVIHSHLEYVCRTFGMIPVLPDDTRLHIRLGLYIVLKPDTFVLESRMPGNPLKPRPHSNLIFRAVLFSTFRLDVFFFLLYFTFVLNEGCVYEGPALDTHVVCIRIQTYTRILLLNIRGILGQGHWPLSESLEWRLQRGRVGTILHLPHGVVAGRSSYSVPSVYR